MSSETKEMKKWQEVRQIIHGERITLGPYYSYQLKNTPRHLLFLLSYYKFAAKLLGQGKYVLEVGCSEGIGTLLLAEFAQRVVAVDIDADAIYEAKRAFNSEKIKFMALDFLESSIDIFDAVVSFDVIEHIYPENENSFFISICKNLKDNGVCIIGTPNKTSEQYASEATRMGHINMYTWDRLRDSMSRFFEQVFMFSVNDEMVHTGFYPMAHYLIAVGVNKKNKNED
ncbi:MAG: class I SAM-dependent methyltransferase [Bacillota bacterium]